MYARVTNFQCDPSRLSDMEAQLDAITAEVKQMPGIEAAYAVWRGDGAGVVTAVYDSQESAEAAAPRVQGVWASVSDYLTAAPTAESYESVKHMA